MYVSDRKIRIIIYDKIEISWWYENVNSIYYQLLRLQLSGFFIFFLKFCFYVMLFKFNNVYI